MQSLVLVEGSFRPGAAVEADVISSGEAPEDAPALSRGTKSLEELSVSVTGSADESSGYRVRYLAPETDRVTSTIALYVREGGGAWQETDYDTLGNYLCFDVDSSDFELLGGGAPAAHDTRHNNRRGRRAAGADNHRWQHSPPQAGGASGRKTRQMSAKGPGP